MADAEEYSRTIEEQIFRVGKMLEAANKRIEGLEDIIIATPDIIWRFDLEAMPDETRTIAVQWLAMIYLKKRELEVVRRDVRWKDPLAV